MFKPIKLLTVVATVFVISARVLAQAPPPPPLPEASLSDIEAGTARNLYISPYGAAQAGFGTGGEGGLSQGQITAMLATKTNTFNGKLTGATNFLNGSKIFSGANIQVTLSKDPDTGATNATVSVVDPASWNQVNAVGLTTTNFYTVTNNQSGVTLIDFASGSQSTFDGLAAGLTITGFSNAVAGVYNEKIVKVRATGSNRAVGWPASWWLAPSVTGTATNGDWTYYWVDLQLGHYTNVLEVYVPHQ